MSLTPHNQAENRYLFSGVLALKTGLHIGSGRGDYTTDSLIIKNLNNTPIIPGSSLRGVFRSHVERMLSALSETKVFPDLWSCQLFEPDLNGKICIGSQSNQQSIAQAKSLNQQIENSGLEAIWEDLERYLCTTCKLFGAGSFWASKIRFSDLIPLEGEKPATQVRHGVGINRDTGTAANQVKFDQEVLESDLKFQFEMIGENLSEIDLMLIAMGLSAMLSGELTIGGSTSRGLGVVKLIDDSRAVQSVQLSNRQELIGYLTTRAYPSAKSFTDFVQEHLAFSIEEEDVDNAEISS